MVRGTSGAQRPQQSLAYSGRTGKPSAGIYAEKATGGKYEQRVKKILEYIEEHYGEYITIEDMARQANVSRTECFRCFQRITGQTPLEYLTFYRLGQAAYKLRNTDSSITEICISSGFSQPSYFGKKFRGILWEFLL